MRAIGDNHVREKWGIAGVSGYVATREADYQGEKILLTLISRRSVYMQGTRFNRRGQYTTTTTTMMDH